MADIMQLLGQARNPDEVALLLSALGQTGSMASPTALQADPMNLSSGREAELLLSAMGRTAPTPQAPVAVDPLFRASGEFYAGQMGQLGSTEAARALLNSLGQTGGMAEKVPMSPSTSAGIKANPQEILSADGPSTPVTPEERMFIDAAYAGIQDDIARLLQDPNKRKELGILEDDGERDIFRDGTANTKGGVNRVNQYTNEHGVTASRDPATGQVMLTNIGANGKPTAQSQKQVYGFNPMNATGSVALDTLQEQIRNAPDADTARGLAAVARTSLAEEAARIEKQSLEFAAKQVGLPVLRTRLAQSEALDRNQPGYMPGIGDSKNTAALRNEVAQAEAQARQVAGDWKKTNISAARLESTAANIEAELRAQDQKRVKAEGLAATTDAQRQRRADIREEMGFQKYMALSDSAKQIIGKLNPTLMNTAGNEGAVAAYYDKQMATEPSFKELMQADVNDIPALAVQGNKLARALIVQEEAVATGRAPDVIDAEIRAITNNITPEVIRQWATDKVAGITTNKEVERRKLEGVYTALAASSDKEDVAKFKKLQAEIGMNMYRKRKSDVFMTDVNSWGVSDPAIQEAVNIASASSGKTDMRSVLTAYVGNTTGPESLAKYAEFKKVVKQAASKQAASKFGGVNTLEALSVVDQTAKAQGQLAEWYRSFWGKALMNPSMMDNEMRTYYGL